LWFQKQEHQRAVEDFSAAIELDPRSALAFNNRGHNLQQLGRHQEALKDFDQAIRLAPEYALAHQNRAWLLATATPLSNRDGQQAVLSAMKVCELRDYKLPGDLLTLAAAFAEDKKFDEAVGWQIKGIELLPEADQGPAEAMLQRYREGRSFDQQLYDAAVKSR
jgi:tetratricopeptide (TPR) repeat protein